MPYCPNPDCPHRSRQGRPAEYREGQEHCADCGAALHPGTLQSSRTTPRARWPRPLRSRLLVTAAVLAALFALRLLPPPFLDLSVLRDLFEGDPLKPRHQFGPLSLGLSPVLSAFVLVEVVAWLIPPLSRRRHGDPGFRARLGTLSVGLGFLLAFAMGITTALWLESWQYQFASFGRGLVPQPGWTFRIEHAATLVLGTGAYVMAARLIARLGVGSGYAVVLLYEMALQLVGDAPGIWLRLSSGLISPAQTVLVVGSLAAITAAAIWVLTRRPERTDDGVPLVVPACGIEPLSFAFLLALIPSAVASLLPAALFRYLADALAPGTTSHLFIALALVLALGPLFAYLFHWRHRAALARPGTAMSWYRVQVKSVGALCLLVAVWYAFRQRVQADLLSSFTAVTLVVLAALVVDLAQEIRARRNAPDGADLVPLAEHQHPVDALLDQAEIPETQHPFVQGLRYRSLHWFFAPYVPLRVLGVAAPDDDDDDASMNDHNEDDETPHATP